VRAACERIERLDPALGAVPVRLFDEALRAGRAPAPGPFRGVPFLMKDVGARQAGQPYYAGNRALRDADHRAERDTPLGARFRELGLVTVGNSSSPEFGLQSNTWPLAYGPTRNPWDTSRAAGGSSGGACAAVAAGLVAVAHASDGAGSIRIPAAWCGLVGLKPSRDRIVWRHTGRQRPDVEFVVARSLRDTAAFLDALRPRGARREEAAPFAGTIGREPGALRVALCTRSPAGTPVDPACIAASQAAARVLEARGHRVEEAEPAPLFEYEERALHGAVLGPLAYRECLRELAQRLGRPVGPEDVEPFLWEFATGGAGPGDPAEVERALGFARAWTLRMLGWFEAHDLLVTPTVHELAPYLSSLDPHRLSPLELMQRMVPHMAFTEPWNATGQPAISLPLGWSDVGLPVGVQLVAAPGREDLLLGVAAWLLAALGEPGRRPPLHA
jgi:amidase